MQSPSLVEKAASSKLMAKITILRLKAYLNVQKHVPQELM